MFLFLHFFLDPKLNMNNKVEINIYYSHDLREEGFGYPDMQTTLLLPFLRQSTTTLMIALRSASSSI